MKRVLSIGSMGAGFVAGFAGQRPVGSLPRWRCSRLKSFESEQSGGDNSQVGLLLRRANLIFLFDISLIKH